MNRYQGALNNDQLIRFSPSIFAEQAHYSRSEKYVHIPTLELVNGMRNEGFLPVQVSQVNSRTVDKCGFGKHLIRFRREEQLDSNEAREVVLLNSHDGSSGFKLMAGVYRMVCANGLIVGQTDNEIKVRHSGDAMQQVIEGAYNIVSDFDVVTEQIESMKAITLSDNQQKAFGMAALSLKYEDIENCGLSADQIIRPRRREDTKNDLWTVFNSTQENMIRGGQRGIKRNATGRQVYTKSREIKGIDQSVALNRGLWTLAEEMKKYM